MLDDLAKESNVKLIAQEPTALTILCIGSMTSTMGREGGREGERHVQWSHNSKPLKTE